MEASSGGKDAKENRAHYAIVMSVRFYCQRCNQLLGIASRKVGSEIACPKCGFSQMVPSEEAAAAANALRAGAGRSASTAVGAEDEFAIYDDAPEPVEVAPRRQRRKASPSRKAATSQKATSSPKPSSFRDQKPAGKSAGDQEALPKSNTPDLPPEAPPVSPAEPSDEPAGPAVPGGMVLFPRRTLYVQGVLVVVLALVFFATGYFIGRGNATLQLTLEHQEALRERTLVEGRVVYRPEPQRLAGDERAVIVALPVDAVPEAPIPIHGLRPQDPDPPHSLRSLRMLEELGAMYARADAEGHFSMVVPDRGEYYILIISRNVGRPRDTDPDEGDMMELGRYFTMAQRLVSRYKYGWQKYDVHGGMPPIEVDFGEDGQE